jgi:hypothetical protein
MQPEEASDIGRHDLCLTELQPKDTPIDQRKHENRFVGCSGISSAHSTETISLNGQSPRLQQM